MPFIPLDHESGEPLTRQIYAYLRKAILTGALPSGKALGSTRRMARELGVSRNVVLNAYEQLLAEGYLSARTGSGTFVARDAALPRRATHALSTSRAAHAHPTHAAAARPGTTVSRDSSFRTAGGRPYRADIIDFRSGLPDLSRFPVRAWQRASREVWSTLTPRDLSYGQPEGREELRKEIALYLAAHRGVMCHPDQILVTAGTTQAVGIVARLADRTPGTLCILEDPITSDIRRIVEGYGLGVAPVPVDGQGLVTEKLPKGLSPRFIYVTPSHQFPIGGTMPIQRRIRLLEYARSCGAYIVEDDYDSEFRYDSPPISSIQGLDPGRVVYIGTFSKTLCPAMRLGYAVLPPELVERGREVKWFSDLHNASVDQMILARFLHEGHFLRYVHAMKKLYRARRTALIRSLESRLAGRVEVLGSPAGLHLCARLPGVRFGRETVRRCEEAGVRVYPAEEHAMKKGGWTDTLIFGYGMLDAKRMDEGVAILARCVGGRGNSRRASRSLTPQANAVLMGHRRKVK